MNDLARRIADLDNKQAIHCLNLVASSATGAPDPATAKERFVAAVAPGGAPAPERIDALVDPDATLKSGGDTARELLTALAEDPDGAKIVAAALDAAPDDTGDFGVVSGAAILVFAWLAVTGDVEVEIGGFKFRKRGIEPKDQVAMGERLMTALAKAVLNLGGSASA